MPSKPEYRFKYGKHKGELISQVDAEYLEWMVESAQENIKLAKTELARREALEDAAQPAAIKLVNQGFRALSRQAHPDHGGDPAEFRKLTAARDALLDLVKQVMQA